MTYIIHAGPLRVKFNENHLDARLLCQIEGAYAMKAIRGETLGAS
jgi:hypothetical protein